MTIKTRPPTGRVAPPLILLEGQEKAGKSYAAAVLSASERVGRTFWIDLGEGSADEYGAIPGTRYEVVEHDGSWTALLANVVEIRELAAQALTDGEPPVVLVIDSMTQEWDLLKDWAAGRARKAEFNRKKFEQDPNAEIDISMNYWNDANTRHRQLMAKLMTFPGIVVMIARGKEVAALDANGKPIPRKTAYSVEGQKNLAFDASLWVRVSREHAPTVVGARSIHAGVRPGVDKPKPIDDFTLDRLVFDLLRYDPHQATTRDLAVPADPELIREEALTSDTTVARLGELWKAARNADQLDHPTTDAAGKGCSLKQLIEARAGQLTPTTDAAATPAAARGNGAPRGEHLIGRPTGDATAAAAAKAKLTRACADNGWDTDKVAELFEQRHQAELDEATSVEVIDGFRESLFERPQAELMAS